MLPSQLNDYVRQSYNAVNDTHFSQSEILNYMYQAQMILAVDAKLIHYIDTTTSTVIGQSEYLYPNRIISITRLEYNGYRVDPRTFLEIDALYPSGVISSGQPTYYTPILNRRTSKYVKLTPIPDAVGTLQFYGYRIPDTVSIADAAIEVPEEFQRGLSHYILMRMAAKDGNLSMANYYNSLWLSEVEKARRWLNVRTEADQLDIVKDFESITYKGLRNY